MPTWRPSPQTVINDAAIGVPMDSPPPTATVSIGFEKERHRGITLGLPVERVLFLSHAVQCRIVRELERRLNRDDRRPIDERMAAYGIGFGRPQVERGVEAVRLLAGTNASSFDASIARRLAALSTVSARRRHLAHAVWATQILHRAYQDARHDGAALRRLRRSNLDRGLRPRFASLQEAVLPARLVVHERPGIIDELLITALVGLANPCGFYRQFSYLEVPFDVLTWVGWVAIYGRSLDPASAIALKERYAADIVHPRPPACVRGSEGHEAQYLAVCTAARQAWANLHMDSVLATMGRRRPPPSTGSAS